MGPLESRALPRSERHLPLALDVCRQVRFAFVTMQAKESVRQESRRRPHYATFANAWPTMNSSSRALRCCSAALARSVSPLASRHRVYLLTRWHLWSCAFFLPARLVEISRPQALLQTAPNVKNGRNI